MSPEFFFEGEGEAAPFVHVGVVAAEFFLDAANLEIEECGFNGGDAHQMPHVDGAESDEVVFGFVDGVVAFEVLVEVVGVGGGVFVDE